MTKITTDTQMASDLTNMKGFFRRESPQWDALDKAAARLASTSPAPDAKYPVDGAGDEDSYNAGWNACREAMLAAAPQPVVENGHG